MFRLTYSFLDNLKMDCRIYTMPLGHNCKHVSLNFMRAISENKLIDKFCLERKRQKAARATGVLLLRTLIRG